MATNDAPQQGINQTIRLRVAGICATVKAEELASRFRSFGTVQDVQIVSDSLTQVKKGFAFVELVGDDSILKKCTSLLNGSKWRGKVLSIEKAKPRFIDRLQREITQRRKRETDATEQIDELARTGAIVEQQVMNTKRAKTSHGWRLAGRQGRPVAVMRMYNPYKRKILTMDPSDNVKNAVKYMLPYKGSTERMRIAPPLLEMDAPLKGRRNHALPFSPSLAENELYGSPTPTVELANYDTSKDNNYYNASGQTTCERYEYVKSPEKDVGRINCVVDREARKLPVIAQSDCSTVVDTTVHNPVSSIVTEGDDHACIDVLHMNNEVAPSSIGCVVDNQVGPVLSDSKDANAVIGNDEREFSSKISSTFDSGDESEPDLPIEGIENVSSELGEVEFKASDKLETSMGQSSLKISSYITNEVEGSDDSSLVPKAENHMVHDGFAISQVDGADDEFSQQNADFKRQQANAKRIESLRSLRESSKKRAVLKINVDAPWTSGGKKIRFGNEGDKYNVKGIEKIDSKKTESVNQGTVHDTSRGDVDCSRTSNRVLSFGDMASSDEEGGDADAERFAIRPVFEGKHGAELLALKSAYKGDARFNLDNRFLDNESESSTSDSEVDYTGIDDEANFVSSTTKEELRVERKSNMKILEAMFPSGITYSKDQADGDAGDFEEDADEGPAKGTKLHDYLDLPKNSFVDMRKVQYDPTNVDSVALFDAKRQKSSREDRANDVDENVQRKPHQISIIPEVSKEKSFDVHVPAMADFFKKPTESVIDETPFTLAPLGSPISQVPVPAPQSFSLFASLGMNENESDEFSESDIGYNDSVAHVEEVHEECNLPLSVKVDNDKLVKPVPIAGVSKNISEQFLFSMWARPDSSEKPPPLFVRTDTMDAIKKRWSSTRERMIKEFKSKRKTNIRRLRHQRQTGRVQREF